MDQSGDSTPVIRRSRVACKACRERRKPTKPRRRSGRARSGSDRNPPTDVEVLPDATVHVIAQQEDPELHVSIHQRDAADKRACQPRTSLTLSSIIQMARHAKEHDSRHFHTNGQASALLVDKVSLQPEPDLGEPLSLRDTLEMPDRRVSDQLIWSFFANFHPAYPVIDRLSFIDAYGQNRASLMLLHAIYMTAFTCGPESLVRSAGYSDRTSARKAHYLRAKTLYDAGHERDATYLAAALHLLSFWWLGPSDQKDSWYWQGCAVTFAQSLGMHRSLAQRGMSPRLTSIWKRIWWSIYDRDRHAAAALGCPCRIRDEDCDIEPLSESDLLVDSNVDEGLLPVQEPYHVAYFLEISRLSVILGHIVIGEFSPHRPALEIFDPASSLQKLRSWRSGLPKVFLVDSCDKPTDGPFWASMLDASYQNALILLFRPKAADCQTFPEAEREIQARKAADAITRTAEDLLAAETMHYAQLHCIERAGQNLARWHVGSKIVFESFATTAQPRIYINSGISADDINGRPTK
ncbi:hypothetical protein FDECE_1035 [Fusarium decemcellulare]|nr:hypothetical protein FDECE_1035 [Fusarium decemcellulare]